MAEDDAKEGAVVEATDAASEKTVAAKPKSGILPIIIIGAAMVLVSAVVTFVVVKMSVPKIPSALEKEAKGKSEPKEKAAHGGGKEGKEGKAGAEGEGPLMYNMDELFVNVAETKGTRILKISPYLVVSEARLIPVLEGYKPMLRDTVSQVASRMTIDELQGINARSNLRREIVATLNNLLKDKMAGAITDVHFSEFLVQ